MPSATKSAGGLASRLHLAWLKRGATILIFLLAVEYLVLPQIAGSRTALHLLGRVAPGWLITGVVLEALALASYSLMTRSVLSADRPSYSWIFRTDLTALGASHVVPGGTATVSPLRYHLLRRGGTPPDDAIVGAAVEGIGSTLMLILLFWLGLIFSIPFSGVHVVYITGATIAAAVIMLIGAVSVRQPSPDSWLSHAATRFVGRLPKRIQGRVTKGYAQGSQQLRQLLADRRELLNAGGWGAGSWLLDAASLWVFLAAYGVHANPFALMVGYGLANLLAILPISPGGLGIIEGVLIPSLVGFGVARGVAVLGVVTWRLFNFWAPIPVAGGCYISLRASDETRSGLWGEFKSLTNRERPASD